MSAIKAGSIAAYFIFPRIIPRMRSLFASGFGYIAFLIANIYNIVRLLPSGHPYLDPNNIGKFGIKHVVAQAANNLVFKKENVDQIIIFTAIMTGLIIAVGQVALLIYMYVVQPAMAQPVFVGTFFRTTTPENDIALTLLDRVFGIPNFFCSSPSAGTGCTNVNADLPFPFHTAMHGMFEFFSLGMLIIGVLIFLYFVVVVVAETAATGTPFGQRFQNVWVPIRLIVAIGLLVPLNHGINSGQYILLFSAKIGSNFATNGWKTFIDRMETAMGGAPTPVGETADTLLSYPTPPDVTPVVEFMSLVHACSYAYWHVWESVDTNRPPDVYSIGGSNSHPIKAYLVKRPQPGIGNQDESLLMTADTTYVEALDFFNDSHIVLTFGILDTEKYASLKGHIQPTCGEIKIHISDLKHKGEQDVGGAEQMQNVYYEMVRDMWFLADFGDVGGNIGSFGNQPGVPEKKLNAVAQYYMAIALRDKGKVDNTLNVYRTVQCDIRDQSHLNQDCEQDEQVTLADRQDLINIFQPLLNTAVANAWQDYRDNTADFDLGTDVTDLGWGGAGLWYNRINQVNGAFIDSVVNVPIPVTMPIYMKKVREKNMASNTQTQTLTQYSPHIGLGHQIYGMEFDELSIAAGLSDFYQWWHEEDENQASSSKQKTGNVFLDAMNIMFGTNNLMAMQGRNAHIHPLAQLTALGKGMVDSAVRNIMGATVSSGMGGLMGMMDKMQGVGHALTGISNFLTTTAFVGLTAGVMLFYILPFFPFLYFYFAVAAWVKCIIEGCFGVTLMALAHLRIDGDGLPGNSAANGYFLIFEVFIRPILTVFGLIASMVIFSAQVRVLHFIWDLVLNNLTGFAYDSDPAVIVLIGDFALQRGIIDQFFFTVIYAIIVYMLATASFKLVDNIPDNMLRWMGAGVSSWGDISGDAPVSGLQRYAAVGGITFGKQTTQAFVQASGGIGGSLGKAIAGRSGGSVGQG